MIDYKALNHAFFRNIDMKIKKKSQDTIFFLLLTVFTDKITQ